jgi:choline dehydrogenase
VDASEFDYVVVGGGTAGCTVAGRLSELGGVTVCLVEAGPDDRNPMLRIPGLGFVATRGDKYVARDMSEPEPGLHNRRLSWVRGQVLGGGSTVNGMIYMRGHSSEYDSWGCESWRFSEVLPYFLKAENSDRAPDPWHGGSGPLRVSRGKSDLPIVESFLEGAEACGHAIIDDLNANLPEGFGLFDHTIGRGRRWSTADAYLDRSRRNLTVLTNSRALRLRIEKGRATGVDIVRRGQATSVRARHEIILTSGALNSPKLLMLSGIGPEEHLQRLGIGVAANAPGVGCNLQNHVRMSLGYRCKASATAYRFRRPLQAIAGGAQYAFAKQGFLSRTVMSAGGTLRSGQAKNVSDLKISLFNALMGTGPGVLGALPKEEGFSIVLHQGSPHSRGEIRLRSSDPLAPVEIRPGNFSDERDVDVLLDGVERARELIETNPMQRLGLTALAPLPRERSALAENIRETAANIFHEVGTCRMGMDEDAVVDTELRVRGVDGLRVADASIIPILMNANTNAPVNMIAERVAAMISHQYNGDVPR